MPSKSNKQHNFMMMSVSEEGRKMLKKMGLKPAPKKVAKDFIEADKRKKNRDK